MHPKNQAAANQAQSKTCSLQNTQQTEAYRLLKMIEDRIPSDEDIKSTFLRNIKLVSANDLLQLVQKECGSEAAQEFAGLVSRRKIASEISENTRQVLISFFKRQEDLVSKGCLEKLEKA